MSRIVPGRRYTSEEMAALRDDPALAKAALDGYVLRANPDGTMQFIRWNKATGGGIGGDLPMREYAHTGEKPWGDLPTISRRTPQERVDSLALKIKEDIKAGRVFSAEQLKELVGWKPGQEISGDIVQRVAQHYLLGAEVEHEKATRKKVADYRPS